MSAPTKTGTTSAAREIKKVSTKPVESHTAVTVPRVAAQEFIDNLLNRAVANELAGVNAFIVKDVEHTLCATNEQYKSEYQTRYDDTMPGFFTEVLEDVCKWVVFNRMYVPKICNSKNATSLQMSIRMLADSNIPATATSTVPETNLHQQQFERYCENMCDLFRETFNDFLASGKVGHKLSVQLSPSQRTLIENYAYPLFAVKLLNRDADMNKLIVMLLVMHETVWRCTDNINVMKAQLTLLMQNGKYNVAGAIAQLDALLDKLAKIFVCDIPTNYKTYIIMVRFRLNKLLTEYAIYVSRAFMNDINHDKLTNNEFEIYNTKMKKKAYTYSDLQGVQQLTPRAKFNNTGKWDQTYFAFSLGKGSSESPSIFKIIRGDNADVTSTGTDIKLTNVMWKGENDVTFKLKFSDGNITKKHFHYFQENAPEAKSTTKSTSSKQSGKS